jgi:hypothetical protein
MNWTGSCPVLPNGHEHDFQETYYGWTCVNCGLFYAFGTAPWEDETDALSDYGDTDEQADRGI